MSIEHRLEMLEARFEQDAELRVQRQSELDGKFEKLTALINDKFGKLSYTIFGNGKVEGSLCWSVREIKIQVDNLEKRVNDLFKTDDWRKSFIAGAVRSIATGLIVAGLIKFIK